MLSCTLGVSPTTDSRQEISTSLLSVRCLETLWVMDIHAPCKRVDIRMPCQNSVYGGVGVIEGESLEPPKPRNATCSVHKGSPTFTNIDLSPCSSAKALHTMGSFSHENGRIENPKGDNPCRNTKELQIHGLGRHFLLSRA